MSMQRVLMTIEMDTTLGVAELKDVQAVIIGALRSEAGKEKQRLTIKRNMPSGLNHDVRGKILQVQVNVVKEAVNDLKPEKPKRARKARKAS